MNGIWGVVSIELILRAAVRACSRKVPFGRGDWPTHDDFKRVQNFQKDLTRFC